MPTAHPGRHEGVIAREVPPQGRAHAGAGRARPPPRRRPTADGSPCRTDRHRAVRRVRGRRRRRRAGRPRVPAGRPHAGPRAAAPGRRADRQRAGRDARRPRRGAGVPGVRRTAQRRPLVRPCARRSPPTSPGAAAPPPSARAASAPSCCARCPSSAPTARTGDPAVPDHRHQRRPLDAARLAARPARASSPRAPRSGRTRSPRSSYAAARPPCPSASRCRSCCPSRRDGSTERHARRRRPAPHRSRLRRSLSPLGRLRGPARPRPAQDARDRAGESSIADAPDRERVRLRGTVKTVTLRPRGGVPALEAELDDGSGVILIVWLGRRRIAGVGPGRSMYVEGRIGTGHRPPDRVQPALRADPVTRADRPPRPAHVASVETVEAGRAPPALAGPRRPPGHGRGGRPDHRLHRPVADHARARAGAGRQRRRGAGAARRTPRAALERPVRRQRAGRHRHRLVLRPAVGARPAAAPTTRRWPTSCPGSSTTPATPWCWSSRS